MVHEDPDLGAGGRLDTFTERLGGAHVDATMFEELLEAPERALGQVVGVLHGDFGQLPGAEVGLEFVRVHVVTGRDQLVGEFHELGLFLRGLIEPRLADDRGDVGADRRGLWLFNIGRSAVEDGAEGGGGLCHWLCFPDKFGFGCLGRCLPHDLKERRQPGFDWKGLFVESVRVGIGEVDHGVGRELDGPLASFVGVTNIVREVLGDLGREFLADPLREDLGGAVALFHVLAVGDDDEVGGKRVGGEQGEGGLNRVLGVAIDGSAIELAGACAGDHTHAPIISSVAKTAKTIDNQNAIRAPVRRDAKIDFIA